MGAPDMSVRPRAALRLGRLRAEWAIQSRKTRRRVAATSGAQRVLLVSSDPRSLVGSKGDEAMLLAAARYLAARSHVEAVGIVTATAAADATAVRLGFEPLRVWSRRLGAARKQILAWRPTAVALVGADMLDGYYNVETSMRMLALGDLCVRAGCRGTVLGFSFNEHPHPAMRGAFRRLSHGLALHTRDEASRSRFRRFSGLEALAVADVAFLLEPKTDGAHLDDLRSWIGRSRGPVLGFNVHPMLVVHPDRARSEATDVDRLVQTACDALDRALAATPDLRIVLIPHDTRAGYGDERCLAPIHAQLSRRWPERIVHADGLDAAETKALTGMLDGVVCGRMHLAIAAFGMGTPVAALGYQDKFEGLLEQLHWPARHLLSPRALRADTLAGMLATFIAELEMLKPLARAALPALKERAQRNLAPLLPPDGAEALPGKTILFISPVPFIPASAGNRQRVAQLVRLFEAWKCRVHFLHVAQVDGDRHAMSRALQGRYHWHPNRKAPRPWRPWVVRTTLAKRFKRYPLCNLDADAWYHASIGRRARELVVRHGVDIVVCEYAFHSRALLALPGVVTLIDAHDVFGDRYRMYLDAGLEPQWYSTSPANEAKALSRADHVLAIQATDAAVFAGYGHGRVFTLPWMPPGWSAPPPRSAATESQADRLELGFVGSLNDVNVDALAGFVDGIFPRLLERGLPVHLTVAGAVCVAFENAARRSHPHISWLGEQADLTPTWQRLDVLVNTPRQATGLPIKVLEALGQGVRILGSAAGVRGLPTDVALGAVRCCVDVEDWQRAVEELARGKAAGLDLRSAAIADFRTLQEAQAHAEERLLRALQQSLAARHGTPCESPFRQRFLPRSAMDSTGGTRR